MEMVLRGGDGGVCVVPDTMYSGPCGGITGVFADVPRVHFANFWVPTSKRIRDRTTIHGEFATCASDSGGVVILEKTR